MSEHVAPVRIAGLPPGVAPGPLGTRFVAYLIDNVVPAVIAVLSGLLVLHTNLSPTAVGVVTFVLVLGWALLVWWMFAVRGAGPGMRLMRLELVGLSNGRPIGWGRFLLRQLILTGLAMTGIGLLVMVIFLVRQPRRQGWHDLAVTSVVIRQRQGAASRLGSQARHAMPAKADQQPPASAPPSHPTPASSPQPAQSGPSPQPAQSAQPAQPRPQPQPLAPPASQPGQPAYPQPQYQQGSYAQPNQQPAPQRPAQQPSLQPPAGVTGSPVAPRPVTPVPLTPPPGALTPPPSAPTPPPPVSAPPGAPGGGQPPIQSPDRPWAPGSAAAAAAASGRGPTGADRSPAGGWRAVLDDGRELEIDGLVLLGRNPQPRPGEEHAALIKIADTTRTVSKSHLELGIGSAGLYVVDRGSTNGSTVTTVSGMSRRCAPGEAIAVEAGSIVSFGDHWLEIRRD